jgi:hypothetical protein
LNTYSDESRLLAAAVLNLAVLLACFRFARRRGGGGAVQAICDALILYFLVQYAAVALPGICGVFNAWSMAAVGLVAAVALIAGAGWRNVTSIPSSGTPGEGKGGGFSNRAHFPNPRPNPPPEYRRREKRASAPAQFSQLPQWHWDADRLGLATCALFTASYLLCYAYVQRFIPPVATDSLVYHLPTAVQWIQTGKLGIYPTWYWNPAASYSPATSSTFMAWWMAPVQGDVLVRFVQLPALMLIFFLTVRLCRLLGCGRTLAGLIAVAAALSRPLFSEAMVQKDDLYVTAFIAAAVLALAHENVRDRLGPWRVGVTLGFILASKYTALLACPVFLFLIDAPFRAKWKAKQFLIVIVIIAVMAGPWYVRNVVLTGNPLYPVDVHLGPIHLQGLFGTERDQQLRAVGGIWHMLSDTYHSLPAVLIIPLVLGWLWSLWAGRNIIVRQPLARACGVGSVITLAIFLVTSPHHEVRYIFPLMVLWFAAMGMGLSRLEAGAWIALIVAIISTLTSFSTLIIAVVASLAGIALAIAAAGAGVIVLVERLKLNSRHIAGVAAVAALAVTMFAYVQWHAYVDQYRALRQAVWLSERGYPREAGAWRFVAEQTPPEATIAYANLYFVYPYYGPGLRRHVDYAPVRRGLHDFLHFPRMGDRVPGDLIVQTMTKVMDSDADQATWLENLRAMHADYLVVAKNETVRGLDADPPELKFAAADKRDFSKIYEDGYGIVFRVQGN